MFIKALPTFQAIPTSTQTSALVDGWKVGQLLSATAVDRQHNGQLQILIGSELLLAKTDLPIKPGEVLQLEVTRLASQALLKLLDPPPRPGQPPMTVSLPLPEPRQAASWQAGQVIPAEYRPQFPGQDPTAKPIIVLAGTPLPLNKPTPLPSDQPLKLEIITPGMPAALRIRHIGGTAVPVADQALREALPRQLSLAPLLANLTVVAQASSRSGSEQLPTTIVAAARQVLTQLPSKETVSQGENLRQAVAQSGLFLEANLALAAQTQQPPANLGGDLKAGLLLLMAALLNLRITRPGSEPPSAPQTITPPPLPHAPPHTQPRAAATISSQTSAQQTLLELFRQVEGGLARIQLSQLASQPVDEDGKRGWLFDLPVNNGAQFDVLQLRIEEQQRQDADGKRAAWTVTIAFELDNLGPVQAKITLAGGAVSAVFWVQQDETRELFNSHLSELQQRLQKAGLQVGALIAQHGMPPEAEKQSPLPYVLLDVEA